MSIVKVLYGETVCDIAVKQLADASRALEVAQLNGISLTDDLTAGTVLQLPAVADDKEKMVRLLNY